MILARLNSLFLLPLLLSAPTCLGESVDRVETIVEVAEIGSSGQAQASVADILGYSRIEIDALKRRSEERVVRFSNLLPEEKQNFIQNKNNGKALVLNGAFIDGYFRLLEADSIFSNDPEVKSLIGMVYLELRLFSKAESIYRNALAALPFNLGHRYNYAESLFVQRKYKLARKHFRLVRQIAEAKGSQLSSMCTLKIQLCHLGLTKQLQGVDSAQAMADYKDEILMGKSSMFSLAYYYSHVVEALRQQDVDQANIWRKYAQYVFPKEGTHKPFIDALIEFGYLSSYYGAKAEQVSRLP